MAMDAGTTTDDGAMNDFPWDAVLALVRWKQSRKGYDGDSQLMETAFKLLPSDDGAVGQLLAQAEREFNVSWQRIVLEVLHFAIFLLTKAKIDERQRVIQTRLALRLLQRAVRVLGTEEMDSTMTNGAEAVVIPTNSCNLLLISMAQVLENINEKSSNDILNVVRDVKHIFEYLFGLSANDSVPNFQTYRPPTNIFADFMYLTLTAVFRQLSSNVSDTGNEKETTTEYVALVRAIFGVFQELQKTQMNKKKVFLSVAKTSLRNLIGYRHALVKLQAQHIDGVQEIVALLDRIVIDALFDGEHIREYEGAYVHANIWKQSSASKIDDNLSLKHSKKRKSQDNKLLAMTSYPKNLFDELKAFLSDANAAIEMKESVGGFMEVLVYGFSIRIRAAANSKIEDTKSDLKTSRKRAATVIATTSTTYSPFKFWSELCAVAYATFQEHHKEQATMERILTKLYCSLFKALCECDIYRVTEDTDEQQQFHTLEKILSSFLNLTSERIKQLIHDHENESSEESSTIVMMQEQCQIISSAVRCSPNLVNCCLISIFEVLGLYVMMHRTKNVVLTCASDSVVDLILAYESMRLLDTLFTSAFASKTAADGLYQLFSHSRSELTLRKSFLTLPPGQLEVLWNLLMNEMEKMKANSISEGDKSLALVRLVFQMFVQEIHVNSQNRAKVTSLITTTHQTLLAPLITKLSSKHKGRFSSIERELFCVFGELLMFYEIVGSSVRSETFDTILSSMKGDVFVAIVNNLLQRSKHNNIDTTDPNGLGSAGIIKMCVHWLRKRGDDEAVSSTSRERVARLVLEYVIEWECWDAIAFYLPELLEHSPSEVADIFFVALLRAYLREKVDGKDDGPANRIVCDAAFYEIITLQRVAANVFATIASDYVKEFKATPTSCLREIGHLFELLSSLPLNYIAADSCGELLSQSFVLFEGLVHSKINNKIDKVMKKLLTWLRSNFRGIASSIYALKKSYEKAILEGTQLVLLQAGGSDKEEIDSHLVAELLSIYLDDSIGADKRLGIIFDALIFKTKRILPADGARVVIVVEALAKIRRNTDGSYSRCKLPDEEVSFLKRVTELVKHKQPSFDDALSFRMLDVLVLYLSATAELNHSKHSVQGKSQPLLSEVLSAHIGKALALSMKTIVATDSQVEATVFEAAWLFFSNFCQEYPTFRRSNNLETYGYMLAVALAILSRELSISIKGLPIDQNKPLQALIVNANKEEFRLLLSTISKELHTSETARVISALKAMFLLLHGDKKLNSSRRETLNECKESILGALVQTFSQSMDGQQPELVVWNLQVLVQFFCKPELFSWRTHELVLIFTGFQPILTLTSQWQRQQELYSPDHVHQIWMLSYTLLLRIIRHHFASLVNGIPHIVHATNALLQLLVLASTSKADKRTHNMPNTVESLRWMEWSSNLARLYGYMKEHDAQLRKHVVYLMLAYLLSVTRHNLSFGLQLKLRPGVFALLDICSIFEKEQLYAALDSAGKSLLKSLDTNYKTTHRYMGKV